MKQVRHLHFPGSRELAAIHERVRDALLPWARAWVGQSLAHERLLSELRITTPAESTAAALRPEWIELGGVWFESGREEIERLGQLVLGTDWREDPHYAHDWVLKVIEQARQERNRALCTLLQGAVIEAGTVTAQRLPADDLFALGSGALEIACAAIGLRALVGNSVWQVIAPPLNEQRQALPRVVSIETAARSASVSLAVVLGAAELDLAQLLDLRCGDVLPLPTRLNESATVLCEGRPFARASLGAEQGHKCVQLTGLISMTHSVGR